MSTPPRSATPATDSTPTGAAATGAAGAALASADPSTGGAGAGGGESSEAKARGLDDEVASLVGGFTSFWGKVKKQVRDVLEFVLCRHRALDHGSCEARTGRDASHPRDSRQVGGNTQSRRRTQVDRRAHARFVQDCIVVPTPHGPKVAVVEATSPVTQLVRPPGEADFLSPFHRA